MLKSMFWSQGQSGALKEQRWSSGEWVSLSAEVDDRPRFSAQTLTTLLISFCGETGSLEQLAQGQVGRRETTAVAVAMPTNVLTTFSIGFFRVFIEANINFYWEKWGWGHSQLYWGLSPGVEFSGITSGGIWRIIGCTGNQIWMGCI